MKRIALFLIITILIIGCSTKIEQQVEKPEQGETQIANPASVYCEEQGGTLEIRTNEDGSQTGYCIFDGGKECEEWKFYRGECKI